MSQKKIIIANNTHASQIEALRNESYHHSKNFSITDDEKFAKRFHWSHKDESGTVLLALDENGQASSTLRGNIYKSPEEHERNNDFFVRRTTGLIDYPVLDLTFAATSPNHFSGGLLSVVRYYMYDLHQQSVRSITGTVVKNSDGHHTLTACGYQFEETNYVREELRPVNIMLLASLKIANIRQAIDHLLFKHRDRIDEFPLILNGSGI